MFIFVIAKTLAKIPKLTTMVRRKTALALKVKTSIPLKNIFLFNKVALNNSYGLFMRYAAVN